MPMTHTFAPPEPSSVHAAIMVTRRCNMSCAHCSVESGPSLRGDPSEADLLAWVRAAAGNGIRSMRFTGGEPMLRAAVVLRLMRECRRLGLSTAMTTNGFWGRSPVSARRHLRALKRAGLASLTVSYDRYHAAFQGPDPVVHIANAATYIGVPLNINIVRGTDEAGLTDVMRDLEESHGTRIRVYDLQPVGRARSLPATSHRAEVEGFCTACAFPAITDDGRVIACNGPAYFEPASSPLVLGSLREKTFAELLDRHRRDPILDTIRTSGPAGLRDALSRIPGFEMFPLRDRYLGICDLCHDITRNPRAVAALGAALDRPELAATRLATWQVIAGSRREGSLSFSFVNGVGACRVFLRATMRPEQPIAADSAHVLGRADLDWRRLADYLCGCGLARPLLKTIDDPQVARWAPAFFREKLRAHGITDGLRELVQRDAIRRIDDVLSELGTAGVLLKGCAFLMRPSAVTRRATSDIDVLVDPSIAHALRARLLTHGFADSAVRGSEVIAHHLKPVHYQGVPIEIHTRVMESLWGLPEAEMRADARPLPGLRALKTFGPEALVLHACVHASASFFSFGLRAASDIVAAQRETDDFDWHRLRVWANGLRAPRAFWATFGPLARDLDLGIPIAFPRGAPTDRGARRAEFVARSRLFRATEGLFDLDVFTKTGMVLMLQHVWRDRAWHLGRKVLSHAARPVVWRGVANRAQQTDVVRQAWRRYAQYRRATGRRAAGDGQRAVDSSG